MCEITEYLQITATYSNVNKSFTKETIPELSHWCVMLCDVTYARAQKAAAALPTASRPNN